jgi:hypothetical protein
MSLRPARNESKLTPIFLMNTRPFDWDFHYSSASFNIIRSLSPELNNRRLPSGFNPDRSRYYVSPFDIDVRTDDVDALKTLLAHLGEDFHSCREHDYSRRYLVHVDFTQVCLLLLDLEGPDNDYGLPDTLLLSSTYRRQEDA